MGCDIPSRQFHPGSWKNNSNQRAEDGLFLSRSLQFYWVCFASTSSAAIATSSGRISRQLIPYVGSASLQEEQAYLLDDRRKLGDLRFFHK